MLTCGGALQQKINQYSRYVLFALFGVFMFAPAAVTPLWNFIFAICSFLGVDSRIIYEGYSIFYLPQSKLFMILIIFVFGWFNNRKNYWLNQGNSFFDRREYQSALTAYNKYLNKNPSSSSSYTALWGKAYCLYALGDSEAALKCCDQYIELENKLQIENKFYGIRQIKASVLLSLKLYQEAIENCNMAIEIHAKSDEILADLLLLKGSCYYHLSDYQKAIIYFDEATQLKADFWAAYFNQACCYALDNNPEQTIESLEKSRQIDRQKALDALKTDADFKQIKQNPQFSEWLQKANLS